MKKPIISIIAAVAENNAIGLNNKLLWHIPDDLRHFKEVTCGHPVIMGQRTYESLGKPLPGRLNLVLSTDSNFHLAGVIVSHSIDEAIAEASEDENSEIFFIGGGQVYKQAIEIADKLYLTIVEGEYDADTFFPDYTMFKKRTVTGTGKYNQYQYKFLELTK